MANQKKSPYVHTMFRCERGAHYQDLIFINDFGKRVVNFHGARERVSYNKTLSEKFCEDYYNCEYAKIPSQSQICFEELKEQIQSVIKKPYSLISNNGSHSSKELLEKLNLHKLQFISCDKKSLIA